MKLTRIAAAAAMVLLGGCGGLGEDVAESFGRMFDCLAVGCTLSSTLATSEMSPHFEAVRTGRQTVLNAHFSTGDGILGDGVRLDTDKLRAHTDGAAPLSFANQRLGVYWSATHRTIGPSDVYSIVLERADGTQLSSSATVPAAFELRSPMSPLIIGRTSEPVAVLVSTPPTETLHARVTGHCGETSISEPYAFAPPTPDGSGSAYLLEPAAVYAAVEANEPTVALTRCELVLRLDRVSQGTVDGAFKAGGRFEGRYRQSLALELL